MAGLLDALAPFLPPTPPRATRPLRSEICQPRRGRRPRRRLRVKGRRLPRPSSSAQLSVVSCHVLMRFASASSTGTVEMCRRSSSTYRNRAHLLELELGSAIDRRGLCFRSRRHVRYADLLHCR